MSIALQRKWYEGKRASWGDVFMDAVDEAIESVLDRSISWGFYRSRASVPQIGA